MTVPSNRGAASRSRRVVPCGLLLVAAQLCFARPALAAAPDSLAPPVPNAATPAPAVAADLAPRLTDLGFENVSADPAGAWIALENRRWRQSSEARGRTAGARDPGMGPSFTFFERRFGLVAGAVRDTGSGVPASVGYPSDRGFTAPPRGPWLASTRRTLDLEVAPLLTYELGRIDDPLLVRFEIEPRLRYNPWPGSRMTASLLIPVYNDFPFDSLRPDLNEVRPGLVTLEQFAWLKGVALVSGTAGILGNNRYGVSVGAARPLARGTFLLDGQADLTGYLAFPTTGAEYSTMSRWTGFAGLTWRAPRLDLAVRARGARYLYGDQGGELELRRAFRDLDVAFFYQRTGGLNVHGMRLLVPLPPMVRPTGSPVRVLPVERMPLDYRSEAQPVGRSIRGAASRDDFLRQLHAPGLATNADDYRRGRGEVLPGRPRSAPEWVSLTGMTGFINTPWCGVIRDQTVELGYNQIPKGAAYDHRDTHRNDVYYAALGFLPRLEAGLRWSVIPGLKAFSDIIPESELTDADRMISGRIEILPARLGRPGLAAGVEDAVGTRRFHSTYVVSGIPFEYQLLQGRFAVGYASRTLTAGRYTLDGAFGAADVTLWRTVAAALEYDTEKWNTSINLGLGFGFRARAALLDWKHVAFGAGWALAL